MYAEIVDFVKENPGLTRREIAARLGKRTEYVDSLLWRLRKYTGALRTEVSGYVRTPGLEEVEMVPVVGRMLSELGHDNKGAKEQERRYYHVDLMGEFGNSWKVSSETKDSIVKVIRGFYRKNRADLPREKVVYARDMLLDTPSSGEMYVRPRRYGGS